MPGTLNTRENWRATATHTQREKVSHCERETKNRKEWVANGWGWRPNENIHGRQIRKATITAHKYTLINVLHFRFCLYMIKLNINWICMYLHKRRYAPSRSCENERMCVSCILRRIRPNGCWMHFVYLFDLFADASQRCLCHYIGKWTKRTKYLYRILSRDAIARQDKANALVAHIWLIGIALLALFIVSASTDIGNNVLSNMLLNRFQSNYRHGCRFHNEIHKISWFIHISISMTNWYCMWVCVCRCK